MKGNLISWSFKKFSNCKLNKVPQWLRKERWKRIAPRLLLLKLFHYNTPAKS